MKKYLIHFMSVDNPSVEDDGIGSGTNFGIYNKVFDSKEEAERFMVEELIPQDKAELEGCYGFDDEECTPNVEIDIENGLYERKELTVIDKYDGYEINTTIYEVVEVDF